MSVAVGQTSMQAPQKSQLESWTAPPAPNSMRVEKPRPASVMAPADDAHLRVELQEGVRLVGLRLLLLVEGARLALPGLVAGHLHHLARRLELAAVVLGAGDAAVGDDAIAQAGVAGLALDDAVAGEAAVRVVGEDQREDGLPGGGGLRAVRSDDHAVGDRRGAGEL